METGDKGRDLRNVWIYCRVANNTNNSIEMQRDRFIRFDNERGFNIAGISQDIGSGLDFSHKGLSEAKQAVHSKNADVVLVFNVSRIGRDTLKTLAYMKELNALGAELLSTTDGIIDIDLLEDAISRYYIKGLS